MWSFPWRSAWRAHPLRSALGQRLLAWLLVLSLGPLAVSATLGYVASRRIITGMAQRDLAALTAAQAGHVRDELAGLGMALGSGARGDRLLVASAAALADAASGPAGQSAASGLASEELARLAEQLGAFSRLVLVGPGGTVLASWPGFGSGARWPDTALVAEAERAGGGFALTTASAERSLEFATPLPGLRDRPSSVVVGTIAPADMGAALQLPARLAGSVSAAITDLAGRPVFTSDPGAPGEEVVTASQAIPGYPLRFVSREPMSAALAGLRWLRRVSLVLAASFLLVLLGAAWFVSRGIVLPVSELVGAVERIAHGDLEARVAVAQKDEVGQLAERFNEMATQLRDSAARIDALHAEQMERAEQLATVGELAAGVAHELKTPLLGIASGAQLLSRRMAGDEEGRRLAGEMLQRIARMEEAIQGLLRYARPAPARLSRLDPNAIVARAVRLVEPSAERSHVRIEQHFAPALPELLLDPDQIGQVVVNLAMNGIEAMTAGGTLAIETRPAEGGVELAVTDSGPGIPAAERERVFRPFYTTKHSGTGLGLAMVRQIVERHGGRIWVADPPGGRGARMVVTLPQAAQQKERTTA